MTNLSHIADNINRIRDQIASAAARAGRRPEDVTLVAVTKTYPVDHIAAALKAGMTDAGENRIQEAVPKIEAINAEADLPRLKWHLIGHLQSNKAKLAVQNFDLIHSVDTVKLAQEINRHATNSGKLMEILIQVNVSAEDTKNGLTPVNTEAALNDVLELCPQLVVQGFMTMAPFETAEKARPHFKALRELKDDLLNIISHERFVGNELSMGMSNDYLVAVEEGATMVRIGSAIFGERRYG